MKVEKQYGYILKMEGMEVVFDRDDYPEVWTGIRYIYKAKKKSPCDHCGKLTDRVVDYLGALGFYCGCIDDVC